MGIGHEPREMASNSMHGVPFVHEQLTDSHYNAL